MKKKMIILITIFLSVIMITPVLIKKNNKKYIMQDGMILAMTITDENGTRNITEFPKRGAYNIEIDCGNTAKGKWLAKEWKLAVEDITGNVKCNISFAIIPSSLKNKVESVNATNNNGYRYSGKQPNNWVWFNEEKWRIIGSIPTCTSSGCATSENLVKIIRAEAIGGLAFNAQNSINNWGSNRLYELLNTKYYGKFNATGDILCSFGNVVYALCDYTRIGISSDDTDYYGSMIKEVYWNTGSANFGSTLTNIYTSETRTQTVSGYVGLMNLSDYGYATSDITYSNTYDMDLGMYTKKNWLYGQGWEYTLTKVGTNFNYFVFDSGYIDMDLNERVALVRPVVYLDSSVYIISGDGTEGNPYQIGM